MLNKKIPVLILLILSRFSLAQTNLTIAQINQKLGKGINMGNMFEAPSETEWGNPFKDDYFDKIAKLGFNSVRIPIRWDIPARALQTDPYTLNQIFLARIKSVVDNAIANKLYVIINMHHHEKLFATPSSEKLKFLSQWTQIAEYFKGYNQNLLFEVMNEPHDNLTPALWNIYFNEALQVIRKSNPTRAVVMGVANYGGLGGLPELKIPEDKNIIISIHYYNPFNFTHQGAEWIGNEANAWLGTKWEDLSVERNQVISEFETLIVLSKQKNIPVHIGEFGSYNKADFNSRLKWTTFLARWFEQQGWSWAYWEWSAGFGIYDPTTSQTNTQLADALLNNPIPEAKKLVTKEIYHSNFNTGNDGWSIGIQSGSEATLSRNNANLQIDVKTSVKDGWHVQLTKNNIAVANKKRYQVTVKAMATNPTSVTCYVAKASAPYSSYSGFSTFSLTSTEKEFSFTFVMNDATDPAARISFDMGLTISKITLSDIKIEEILNETATAIPLSIESELEAAINVYPNPANENIILKHPCLIKKIELFDSIGKKIETKKIENQYLTILNLQQITSGIYYIYLYSDKEQFIRKIIKK